MSERPILFSAPMVRAILEGRKTQTRRVVKKVLPVGAVDPKRYWGPLDCECIMDRDYLPSSLEMIRNDCTRFLDGKLVGTDLCPYGEPGDRLWVREAWLLGAADYNAQTVGVKFRAGGEWRHGIPCDSWPQSVELGGRWTPSIHMPRWASRITLEITEVRVQRLQEISEEDAIAEGVEKKPAARGEIQLCDWWKHYGDPANSLLSARDSFRTLWESINGAGSWDANPWVWALTFQRVAEVAATA